MAGADVRRVVKLLEQQVAARATDLAGPFTVEPMPGTKAFGLRAFRLVPVEGAAPGDLRVPVPVSGRVELAKDGSLANVEVGALDRDAIAEARDFAKRLLESGGVEGVSGAAPRRPLGRPTHAIEVDAAGRRVLRRIGFSGRS